MRNYAGRVRIGISITSSYVNLDGPAAVATVVDRARAAGAVGLDHLSLGDHHSVGPRENYVQNVPMIGRIMADWPVDRPIGLLLLLPMWNPVLAAEQIGTLACLSDAPFIVQTGIGAGKRQFAGIGATPRNRGAQTDRAISVMKRLFDGEVVDVLELGLSGSCIGPRPPRPVEWWIGSGLGDEPIERAAREGDAWYISPGVTYEELLPAIDHYRSRCEAHGTTPRVALRRDVFVADDDAAGRAVGEQMASGGYRGMRGEVLVCGGVERVAESLSRFAAIGVDDIVARTVAVEPDRAVRSIELLGSVREHLIGSAG